MKISKTASGIVASHGGAHCEEDKCNAGCFWKLASQTVLLIFFNSDANAMLQQYKSDYPERIRKARDIFLFAQVFKSERRVAKEKLVAEKKKNKKFQPVTKVPIEAKHVDDLAFDVHIGRLTATRCIGKMWVNSDETCTQVLDILLREFSGIELHGLEKRPKKKLALMLMPCIRLFFSPSVCMCAAIGGKKNDWFLSRQSVRSTGLDFLFSPPQIV